MVQVFTGVLSSSIFFLLMQFYYMFFHSGLEQCEFSSLNIFTLVRVEVDIEIPYTVSHKRECTAYFNLLTKMFYFCNRYHPYIKIWLEVRLLLALSSYSWPCLRIPPLEVFLRQAPITLYSLPQYLSFLLDAGV